MLRGALGWIFDYREITRVSLTVRVDNPAAFGLYRAEGFETERVALGWLKEWIRS